MFPVPQIYCPRSAIPYRISWGILYEELLFITLDAEWPTTWWNDQWWNDVSNLLPTVSTNRYHVVSLWVIMTLYIHLHFYCFNRAHTIIVIEALISRIVSLPVARPRHEPDRFRFPDFLWILSPKTGLKSDTNVKNLSKSPSYSQHP